MVPAVESQVDLNPGFFFLGKSTGSKTYPRMFPFNQPKKRMSKQGTPQKKRRSSRLVPFKTNPRRLQEGQTSKKGTPRRKKKQNKKEKTKKRSRVSLSTNPERVPSTNRPPSTGLPRARRLDPGPGSWPHCGWTQSVSHRNRIRTQVEKI